jgi:hypothetical protein
VFPVNELDGTRHRAAGHPGPTLNSDEIDALVAFLETLTDDRVVFQRAPFDHPQLFVPNGHPGNSNSTTDADGDGLADDVLVEIPAIGAVVAIRFRASSKGFSGRPPDRIILSPAQPSRSAKAARPRQPLAACIPFRSVNADR